MSRQSLVSKYTRDCIKDGIVEYSEVLDFSEMQLRQVGGVMYDNGLSIFTANKLIDLWNHQSKLYCDGQYVYSLEVA